MCWNLYKTSRRIRFRDRPRSKRASVDEDSDSGSTRGRKSIRHHSGSTATHKAKAKIAAKRNVVGRLARESNRRQDTDKDEQ